MPTIEELGPEQTTLPLKIFILLRFAFKLFFWISTMLVILSIILWASIGIWNGVFPHSAVFR